MTGEARQSEIQEHKIGWVIPDAAQGCLAVVGGNELIAGVAKNHRKKTDERTLILDDEDPRAAM
jgi:hypothetical protein